MGSPPDRLLTMTLSTLSDHHQLMRSVTYYVAASLDGFIAHPAGSFAGFPWDDEFGAALLEQFPETFPAHLKTEAMAAADNRVFDTVLMGRKTYEVGSKAGFAHGDRLDRSPDR